MLAQLKLLLGFGPKVNYAQLIKEGAIVLDVRTKSEFNSGNVKGSTNIPLDQLRNNLSKFKDKEKAIITCCASGMRSAAAKSLLKSNGFKNVHNGGSWYKVNSYK